MGRTSSEGWRFGVAREIAFAGLGEVMEEGVEDVEMCNFLGFNFLM